MRRFIPLAAVLVALAGSRADEKLAAPVPKAPVPPSIDGKYTLLTTYGGVPTPKGKFAADPADGPGDRGNPWGSAPSRLTRGDVTITKSEITIEPRTVSGLPVTMEYTLDPTKTPIAIDVEVVPVRGKKTRQLGVIEITGTRMTLALAKEGAERPKSADEGEGVTVYYFQKVPPAPRAEYRIVAMTIGKEAEAEKELNQLSKDGFELVNTTSPLAPDAKSAVTTVHFVLKRIVK